MRPAGLLTAALLALATPVAADQPAPPEEGRAIFEGSAGLVPIIAGRARPALAGRMTCAGCHGSDGRGGTEGGAARAPAIHFAALARKTGARPAYDNAALGRAIRQGKAADGRPLQMPQFEMSEAQLSTLIAYLQWLDHSETRGLSATSITLRLPVAPEAAKAARAAIDSFNAEGGSFGRHVVAGEAAFADLGSLLDRLRPRLAKAEQQIAESRLLAEPGWRIIPRDDPAASLSLSRDGALAVVGPAPASLIWARETGAGLEAARIHALTLLVLEQLRLAGRMLTRSAFEETVSAIVLSPALAIYDDRPTPP